METVYIETTIPSFYYEAREEPEMVARRNWTREWWNERGLRDFDLVTSQAVIDELSRGQFPDRDDALRLVNDLELLPVVAEIEEIVAAYISHSVMPNDALGDALHLALASFCGCDYLLTWNCTHIANAANRQKIETVCRSLGYQVPIICTPFELPEEES